MLPIEEIKIDEGQFLSHIEKFQNGTPNNYIIFKTLPGLGATRGEAIEYLKRHSIIIEPNVPVLINKESTFENGVELYKNVLFVYKGVKTQEIKAYLQNDIFPKKIMCTPEAYTQKVKSAIENSSYDLYNDFFLLLDECEKLVKDVDFRPNIILPMKDFFKFKNKAMVSATAIEPSDPRFAENGFKILIIKPTFDYVKKLKIIETNNLIGSLQQTLELNEGKEIFIFVNSTSLIYTLMDKCDLLKKSKVFCAPKSVRFLKKHNFENASSNLSDYGEINFLTSRCFSAVDIELANKPCVIMISDTIRKEFTMLHPYCDSVQIIGRFRKGTSNIIHISNFDECISWQEKMQAKEFINDSYKCYTKLDEVAQENDDTEGGYETGVEAIKGTKIHSFVDEDKKLCTYMTDNYILEQEIKSTYQKKERLVEEYSKTGHFAIECTKNWFEVSDNQMMLLENREYTFESVKAVASILLNYQKKNVAKFMANDLSLLQFTYGDTVETIKSEHPVIAEIYDELGYYRMEDLNFNLPKMKKEMKRLRRNRLFHNPEADNAIRSLYVPGQWLTNSQVKKDIQEIYHKYNIPGRASASDIVAHYDLKNNNRVSTITGNKKVWKIISAKPIHNIQNTD